jgi:hypothetical protein
MDDNMEGVGVEERRSKMQGQYLGLKLGRERKEFEKIRGKKDWIIEEKVENKDQCIWATNKLYSECTSNALALEEAKVKGVLIKRELEGIAAANVNAEKLISSKQTLAKFDKVLKFLEEFIYSIKDADYGQEGVSKYDCPINGLAWLDHEDVICDGERDHEGGTPDVKVRTPKGNHSASPKNNTISPVKFAAHANLKCSQDDDGDLGELSNVTGWSKELYTSENL